MVSLLSVLHCLVFWSGRDSRGWLNGHLTQRARFVWLVVVGVPFLLLCGLNDINCGHVGECAVLSVVLLDNMFVRFGLTLYEQFVGVPMGAGCAPLVAGLFLFCCGVALFCLYRAVVELILLGLLAPRPDVWMVY